MNSGKPIWLLIPLLVCGCAQTPDYQPFDSPIAQAYPSVSRVGDSANAPRKSKRSDRIQLVGHEEENAAKPTLDAGALTAADEPQLSPPELLPAPAPTKESSPLSNDVPIDFANALSIAGYGNPSIKFASARVREAHADETLANSMWLPSIRIGASFYNHNGVLQNAAGDVFNVNRGSIFTGLGSRAVGSGSPAVPGALATFSLADAYYEPLIAERKRYARVHDTAAMRKNVLLATSLAYLKLLEAYQLRAVAGETQSNAEELLILTTSFSKAGQGPQSDADRAMTEFQSRKNEYEKTIELIATASASLRQSLSLDGLPNLVPIEKKVAPVDLVDCENNLDELIAMGLAARNELASSQNELSAACVSYKKERLSPYLPTVTVAASYGGFGGGVEGNFDGNFDDRFDFDAYAYWNLRNLGFGEKAARQQAGARLQQAQNERHRLRDLVTREISQAYAQVKARQRRMEVTRKAIDSAQHAYDRDVMRIRQGEGLPIEALTSLRALDAARRDFLQSIVDHNEAQFRLLHAMGWSQCGSQIELNTQSDFEMPSTPE